MTAVEETFRRVLAARLPSGPAWAAWIDGTVAELAAVGVVLGSEDIPRVVYALRNQDHTSEADWQLATRLEGTP